MNDKSYFKRIKGTDTLRQLSGRAGRKAHRLGRAHEWNSETARAARMKYLASRKAA